MITIGLMILMALTFISGVLVGMDLEDGHEKSSILNPTRGK